MKFFLIAFTLIYFYSCKGQNKYKELNFPQVGWTVDIPKGSQLLSSLQFDSLQNATQQKIGKGFRLKSNEVLFIMKRDEFNFFGSSITPFDSSNFKNWESSYSYYKKMFVDLVESEKSIITLVDNASTIENIDGILFQRFYIRTKYPKQNITRDTYLYYRKQDNIEFSINISYNDSIIGEQYLAILRASKFIK